MQVLFNMAAVSYTAACTATTTAAIQASVIPPGVTLPAGSTIPPLVNPSSLPLPPRHPPLWPMSALAWLPHMLALPEELCARFCDGLNFNAVIA